MIHKLKTKHSSYITINDDNIVSVEYVGKYEDCDRNMAFWFEVVTVVEGLRYKIGLYENYENNDNLLNKKFLIDWGFGEG